MPQTSAVAEVFPPGEFLRDEIEARGWTQSDLADIMGRPIQAINEILAAKKAITPETATALGAALGTSAELWLNLESAYQLSQVSRDVGAVAKRAELYNKAPIKEMIRRSWLPDEDDPERLEQQLLKFLEIETLDESPQLAFAARKSTDYAATTPAQIAWLCRVRQLARAADAKRFDPNGLEQWLTGLPKFIADEASIREIPRSLADIGVRLVIVEHLAKTRIDGAALWLDDARPVVALSLRFGRIDHFWFTLCHELVHIRHHDKVSLDNDLVGESAEATAEKPSFEQRADREAAALLVHQGKLDNFIQRVRPLYSKKRIIQLANSIQVHPGIIVGQLQRRKEIGYNHSREMLVNVRDLILPEAVADGWGYKPTKPLKKRRAV